MKIDWAVLGAVAGVAGVAVAVVGVLVAVVVPIALSRRGTRLSESSTQREEAKAWSGLRDDWRLARLAAGQVDLASRAEAQRFMQLLLRYRDARVALADVHSVVLAGDRLVTGSGQVPEFDQAFDDSVAAGEALAPYRDAVHRVLRHVGDVADRVVRGRLGVAAAYAALGHDIVTARPALRRLLMISADSDGCPGSSYGEARAWRRLDVVEINERVGWGDPLGPHRATAARIRLLEDLLTDHAVRLGDAGFSGPLPLTDHWDAELADLSFLPEVWRGTRPEGLFAAWRWTWQAASIARRASGRRGRRPANPRVTEVSLAAWQARQCGPDPRWVPAIDPEWPEPPAQVHR